MPGPKNDKVLPYMASRRLYGLLLAAGVRIYEYQPAMMHAKTMLIDHRFVTLGSTNFDPRSFFLNSELNTTIGDPAFAAEVEAFFFGRSRTRRPSPTTNGAGAVSGSGSWVAGAAHQGPIMTANEVLSGI